MKWAAVLFVVAFAIDGLPALNLPLGSSNDANKKTSSTIGLGVGVSKAGGLTLTKTASHEEHLREANQQNSIGRTVSKSADGTSTSQKDIESRRSEESERNSKQEDTQELNIAGQNGLLQSQHTSRQSGDATKTQEEYQKEKFTSHDENGANTHDVSSLDESGNKHQIRSSYDETKTSSLGLGNAGLATSQTGSRSDTRKETNSDFSQKQRAEEETLHQDGTTLHREDLSESSAGGEDSEEYNSQTTYNHQGGGIKGSGNQGLLGGFQARSSHAHRGPIRPMSRIPNHGTSERHAYNQHRNYARENGYYGRETRDHGGSGRYTGNFGTHNGGHKNGYWNHAYNSEELAREAGHHRNSHFVSGIGHRHQEANSAEYINHANAASHISESGYQGVDANEDASTVHFVDSAIDNQNQEINSGENDSKNVSDESESNVDGSGFVDESYRRDLGKGVKADQSLNDEEHSGQHGSKYKGAVKTGDLNDVLSSVLNKPHLNSATGNKALSGKYNAIARHENGYQGNSNGDLRGFHNRPHFGNQRVNSGKYNGVFAPTDNVNYGPGNGYHSSQNEYLNGLFDRARGGLNYPRPINPRPIPGQYINGGFVQGGHNNQYDIEDYEDESQDANAKYLSDILTQVQQLLKHGAVPNSYGVTPSHHHHSHQRPVYETPNLGIRFYDAATGSYMANPASTADEVDTYEGVAPGYVVPAVILPEFNGYPNRPYYGPNYYGNGDFGSGPSYIPGIDRSGPTTIFGRNPSVLPLSTIPVSNVANIDDAVVIDRTLAFAPLPPLTPVNPFKPMSPLTSLTPLTTFDNDYEGTSGDASENIIDKDLLRGTFESADSLKRDGTTTAINEDLTSKITHTTHPDSDKDGNSKINNGAPSDKTVLPKQTGKPVKGNEKMNETYNKITKEKSDDDKLGANVGKDDDKTIKPGKSIIIDKTAVNKDIYNHRDVSKKGKTEKSIEKVLETIESRPSKQKEDKSNEKTTSKNSSGKDDKPNSNDNDEISKTDKSFTIDVTLVNKTINKDKTGKENIDKTSTKTREVSGIESKSETLDESNEETTKNSKSIVIDKSTLIKHTGKVSKDIGKNDKAVEEVKRDLGKDTSHVITKAVEKTFSPVKSIFDKAIVMQKDHKTTESKNADKDGKVGDKKEKTIEKITKTLGNHDKSDDIGKMNDGITKNGTSTVTENTDNQVKDNVKTLKTDANVERALETNDASRPVDNNDDDSIKNVKSIVIDKYTVIKTIHKDERGKETLDETSTETKEVLGNDGKSDSNEKSDYESTKNSKSKENKILKNSDIKSNIVEKITNILGKIDKTDDIGKDNDGNTKLVKSIVIDKAAVIKNVLGKDDGLNSTGKDDDETTKTGKSKSTEDTDKDEQDKNITDKTIDKTGKKDGRSDANDKENDDATNNSKSIIGIKNTTLKKTDSRKDDVLENNDYENTVKNGKSTVTDIASGDKNVDKEDNLSSKSRKGDKSGRPGRTEDKNVLESHNDEAHRKTQKGSKSKINDIKDEIVESTTDGAPVNSDKGGKSPSSNDDKQEKKDAGSENDDAPGKTLNGDTTKINHGKDKTVGGSKNNDSDNFTETSSQDYQSESYDGIEKKIVVSENDDATRRSGKDDKSPSKVDDQVVESKNNDAHGKSGKDDKSESKDGKKKTIVSKNDYNADSNETFRKGSEPESNDDRNNVESQKEDALGKSDKKDENSTKTDTKNGVSSIIKDSDNSDDDKPDKGDRSERKHNRKGHNHKKYKKNHKIDSTKSENDETSKDDKFTVTSEKPKPRQDENNEKKNDGSAKSDIKDDFDGKTDKVEQTKNDHESDSKNFGNDTTFKDDKLTGMTKKTNSEKSGLHENTDGSQDQSKSSDDSSNGDWDDDEDLEQNDDEIDYDDTSNDKQQENGSESADSNNDDLEHDNENDLYGKSDRDSKSGSNDRKNVVRSENGVIKDSHENYEDATSNDDQKPNKVVNDDAAEKSGEDGKTGNKGDKKVVGSENAKNKDSNENDKDASKNSGKNVESGNNGDKNDKTVRFENNDTFMKSGEDGRSGNNSDNKDDKVVEPENKNKDFHENYQDASSKSGEDDISRRKRGHKRRNHTKGDKNPRDNDSTTFENDGTSKDDDITATSEKPQLRQNENNDINVDDGSTKKRSDSKDDDKTSDKSNKGDKSGQKYGNKRRIHTKIGRVAGENDEISEDDKLTVTSEKPEPRQDENDDGKKNGSDKTDISNKEDFNGSDDDNTTDKSVKSHKSKRNGEHKHKHRNKIGKPIGQNNDLETDSTNSAIDASSPKSSQDKNNDTNRDDSSIKEDFDYDENDKTTDQSDKGNKSGKKHGHKRRIHTKIGRVTGNNDEISKDDKSTVTSEKPKTDQDENIDSKKGDLSIKIDSDNNYYDKTSEKDDKSGTKHGHQRRIHTRIGTVASHKKHHEIDSAKTEKDEISNGDKSTVTSAKLRTDQDENKDTKKGDSSIKMDSDNNYDDNTSEKGDQSETKHGHKRRIHTRIGTVASRKKHNEIDSTKSENDEIWKDDKSTVTSEKPKTDQDENKDTKKDDSSMTIDSNNNYDDKTSEKDDKSGTKHGHKRRIHTRIGTVASHKKHHEINPTKTEKDEISNDDKPTVTSDKPRTDENENKDTKKGDSSIKIDSNNNYDDNTSEKGDKSGKKHSHKRRIHTRIGTVASHKKHHEIDSPKTENHDISKDDKSTVTSEKPKTDQDENKDTKKDDSSMTIDSDNNYDDKTYEKDDKSGIKHGHKRRIHTKIGTVAIHKKHHEIDSTKTEKDEISIDDKSTVTSDKPRTDENENKDIKKGDSFIKIDSDNNKSEKGDKSGKKHSHKRRLHTRIGTVASHKKHHEIDSTKTKKDEISNDDKSTVTSEKPKTDQDENKDTKKGDSSIKIDSDNNYDDNTSEKGDKSETKHGHKRRIHTKIGTVASHKKHREIDSTKTKRDEISNDDKSTVTSEKPKTDQDENNDSKKDELTNKNWDNDNSTSQSAKPQSNPDENNDTKHDDSSVNENVDEDDKFNKKETSGKRKHKRKHHNKIYKILGQKNDHETDSTDSENNEASKNVKSTGTNDIQVFDKTIHDESDDVEDEGKKKINKSDENKETEKKINRNHRSKNSEDRENRDEDEDEDDLLKSGKGGRFAQKNVKVLKSEIDGAPEKSVGDEPGKHGGKQDKEVETENGNKEYSKEHDDDDKGAAEKSNKGGRIYSKKHKKSHKVVERKGQKNDRVTDSEDNENDGDTKQVKSTVDSKKTVSDEISEDQKDETVNKGSEKRDEPTNEARNDTNENGKQTEITDKRLRNRGSRRWIRKNKNDVKKTKKDLQSSNVNGSSPDDLVDDSGEHNEDSKLTDQNTKSVNRNEKHKIRTKLVKILRNHESSKDHSDTETMEKSKSTTNYDKAVNEETDNNDKTSTKNDVSGHKDETSDNSNSAVNNNNGNKETSSQVTRKDTNTKDKDASKTDANTSKDTILIEKYSSSHSKTNSADDNEKQDNELEKEPKSASKYDSTNNSNADKTTDDLEQKDTTTSSENDDAISDTKNTAVTNNSKAKSKILSRITDLVTKTRHLIKRKPTADSASGKSTETDDGLDDEEMSNINTADNNSPDEEKSRSTSSDNKTEKSANQSDESGSPSTNSEVESQTSSTDTKTESSDNQSDESRFSSNETADHQLKDETKSKSNKKRKEESSKSASGYGAGAEEESFTKDGKRSTYKRSSQDSEHSEQQGDSKYSEESSDSNGKTVESGQKSASEEANNISSDIYEEESDGKTKKSKKDSASAEDEKNQASSSSEYEKVDSNGNTKARKSSSRRHSAKSSQSSSTEEEYHSSS